MEHDMNVAKMSTAERHYNELMLQGDDFFKIELLRQARGRYIKALDYKLQTAEVERKISECNRLLAYETRIVRIIGAVVLLAVALVIIL